MAIGLNIGSRLGPVLGGSRTSGGTWTIDGSSEKALPQTVDEYAALLTAAGISRGNPSHLWTCQESSGNLVDVISGLELVAAGAPGYQQALAGWDAKAVSIADASTTDVFAATSGQGPDVASESVLWLFYVSLPTPPSTTSHFAGAAAYSTGRSLSMANNGRVISYVRNAAVLSVNNYNGIGVFPIVLQYDRTNGTALTFTHLEKITNTYDSTALDGAKGIGSLTGAATPELRVAHIAAFEGAAAEMPEAEIKSLLETANWTLSY